MGKRDVRILRKVYLKIKDQFILVKKFFRKYPKRFYRYTIESLDKISTLEYWEVNKSYVISRTDPFTVHSGIDDRFNKGYLGKSFTTPATFVINIPRGRVIGSSGYIVLPDNKLAADLSIEIGVVPENAENHPLLKTSNVLPIRRKEENIAVLTATCGTTYFHWMYDVLPRYAILCKRIGIEEIDKFILPEIKFDFQRKTLDLLGIPKSKIIEADAFLHVEAKNLIVPSLPGITGSMTVESCDFLRELFLKKEFFNNNSQSKIYISRAKAPARKVINENQVELCLKKYGFQTLYLEDEEFLAQVKYMCNASVVVAPHGAGLTNLVFCSSHCKVIEMFSPGYLNPCYRALCNIVGLEYWYIIGRGEIPSNDIDHLAPSVLNDFEVDIALLEDTLLYAGINLYD